ncbi:hypothetical protein ONZ45_g2089 [Pleurotus djamor]|nr:hypothetical protein ONZ45_g2089 [Pleurotus djamor]
MPDSVHPELVDGVTTKVVFVGVGGATCSGKTTLAKHLRRILPNSVIIHQDDFAPPIEEVPIHPVYGIQDWDSAAGAISWPRLVSFLRHVKETGVIPPDHRSHDHLNEQKAVPIPDRLDEELRARFTDLQTKIEEKSKVKVIWGLVDGFLLYWNKDVVDQLDVQFFIRVPHDVLKRRRHERHGYHTAEGALWRDPPEYWETIVYPAYLDAHRHLFVDGDTEHGKLRAEAEKLVLLDALEMTMGDVVEKCSRSLEGALAEI